MKHHRDTALKTIRLSMAGSAALALIKGFSGYFGDSYALIADAIESGADVLSSLLIGIGLYYSTRPADARHPYGHGRLEPLITFTVVAFLVASATGIAWESLHHIRTPHALPKPFTLWVLGGIIVWKEASYRYVLARSRQTGSSALEADAWHHRSDAVTSLAAFLGIGLALYMGPGFESADDWAALFASGFILYNAWLLFRPALGEILDEHRYDDLIGQIRTISHSVPGVTGTEKCFIRKAGMQYHVDLHVGVDPDLTVREGHRIAHQVKDTLQSEIPGLGHVSIHTEPMDAEPSGGQT